MELFKHGERITCELNGTKIKDAKISIYENDIFICQNKHEGATAKDLLGYPYSWLIENSEFSIKEYNIKFLDRVKKRKRRTKAEIEADKKEKEIKIKGKTVKFDKIIGLNDEIKAITTAAEHNYPTLLIGETGCGKSYIVSEVAKTMKKHAVRLNLNGDIGINELVGKWLVKDGNTYWQDGPLTQCMRNGDWFIADEINAALPEVLFCLNSVMDDGKSLVLAEKDNEVVECHPNFRIFATMNPCQEYAGTKELNKALLSRFIIVLQMDYLEAEKELEIVKMHTKIEEETGSIIIDVANKIREAREKQITWFTCSTRDIINWAKIFLTNNSTLEESFNLAIFNKTSYDEREAIKKYIKDNIGFSIKWSQKSEKGGTSLFKETQNKIDKIKEEIVILEQEKEELQRSINEFLPETLSSLRKTCDLLEKQGVSK